MFVDLHFLSTEENLYYLLMEDNLTFFVNGRQPQFFLMDDVLNFAILVWQPGIPMYLNYMDV